MGRVLISGTHSGCGKTTVTCGLLSALKDRGVSPVSFKCGPDYIDPMFHRRTLGVPSHNLDLFFSSPEQLAGRLATCGGDIVLLEGAMGYYDGVGSHGRYSAYDMAVETSTPVVLVIDVKGMYASAGAVMQGFARYKPQSGISGVIFNNCSPMLYDGLCQIARAVGIEPLGFLPRESGLSIGSRNLGLVAAGEIKGIEQKLALMGKLAEQYIDIDGICKLAASAPLLKASPVAVQPLGSVRIGVAKDAAFCFLYEENLELLTALGCDIAYFSPLSDAVLPPDIGGLYLCGGYPELHAQQLSANNSMLKSIAAAIRNGMPTIAECGGFLYLHNRLDDIPMAGIIHANAYRTDSLKRFGYVTLRANTDNLLCTKGEEINAHEFHYYDSDSCGSGFVAGKPFSGRSWSSVHATDTLYAGFPHLYLDANPAFAQSYVKKALEYHTRQRSGNS